MAGIDVQIELRDDLSAALGRAIEASIDLTTPMKDIAGRLADETRERFETGRSPLGVPWKVSRRARQQNGKTLVDRGDLVGSIREDWGADFAAVGPEASAGAAIYAAIHQFGGTIKHPGGTAYKLDEKRWASFVRNDDADDKMARTGAHDIVIPARPYLGFTDADAEYAVEVLADHLAAAFAAQPGASA